MNKKQKIFLRSGDNRLRQEQLHEEARQKIEYEKATSYRVPIDEAPKNVFRTYETKHGPIQKKEAWRVNPERRMAGQT